MTKIINRDSQEESFKIGVYSQPERFPIHGRTDEDCVILKDKNGSFIAGYNAQFIEENKYGLIIYTYISNKNPDSTHSKTIIKLINIPHFNDKRSLILNVVFKPTTIIA